MKLTDVVFSSPAKKFLNYKHHGYLYKVVRIPALKDEVKVRKAKGEAAHCVNEMTTMMNCWKRSDFNPLACSVETDGFYKCVAAAKLETKEARERAAKGLPAKGSTMRPSSQVNEMLARYPQPATNLK